MQKKRINVSRREFLVSSTALGAGFSLGLYLPLNTRAVAADAGTAAKSYFR